jgi:hypothetical protein
MGVAVGGKSFINPKYLSFDIVRPMVDVKPGTG